MSFPDDDEKVWLNLDARIQGAFTEEQAAWVTQDVWTRLGMAPDNKSTWNQERVHMPGHRTFDCAKLAPRAWAAICEICGGEDKVRPESRYWQDSLIVNLGTVENEGKPVPPQQLYGWHVDGDFFVHYLDSAEQGLLVIPLFTDIVPDGGGTVICPEAMPKVAAWLHDHPEGVNPRMIPRGEPGFEKEGPTDWFNSMARSCTNFVEAGGKCGDVYLLHPLMLHSASTNPLRRVRIITNPPVSMREPFSFHRKDRRYTLVERATLRALGRESLPNWKITAPREMVVPERVRRQEKMKAEELARLQKGTAAIDA